MKQKLITLGLIILTTIVTNAQQNKVHSEIPKLVKDAFEEKYPDIHVKKWKQNKESFVANFFSNKKAHKATFDKNGEWVQTEKSIKFEELPMVVVNAYFSKLVSWENWTSAKEIQTPIYEKAYLIEGDNYEEESSPLYSFKLYFKSNGDLIKKESDE